VCNDDAFDAEDMFGRPQVYLSPIEAARLVILKSRLGDNRDARLTVEWPSPELRNDTQEQAASATR
jgi:hypothetical protein